MAFALEFRGHSYLAWEDEVDGPRSGVLDIEIRLSHGATILGTVVDAHDAPGANTVVTADTNGIAGKRSARTDANGRYRIDGIEPGLVTVKATAYDRRVGVARAAFEIGAGGQVVWGPVSRYGPIVLWHRA